MIQENLDYKITAFKQRETFISTINHDLKIPTLAQIRALEILADESLGMLNPEQKEIVNLTLESCKAMYEMMSAIMYCYKFENQEIVPDFKTLDIISLFDECFKSFDNEFAAKNLHGKIYKPQNIIKIKIDRELFIKALRNIIIYGISCAGQNTELSAKIELTNNVFIASMSFENRFMKRKNLKHMFNGYTTPEEKLDKLGSNLRLYLAKEIIEAHNGKLVLETNRKNFICKIKILTNGRN